MKIWNLCSFYNRWHCTNATNDIPAYLCG